MLLHKIKIHYSKILFSVASLLLIFSTHTTLLTIAPYKAAFANTKTRVIVKEISYDTCRSFCTPEKQSSYAQSFNLRLLSAKAISDIPPVLQIALKQVVPIIVSLALFLYLTPQLQNRKKSILFANLRH